MNSISSVLLFCVGDWRFECREYVEKSTEV